MESDLFPIACLKADEINNFQKYIICQADGKDNLSHPQIESLTKLISVVNIRADYKDVTIQDL